MPGSAQKKNLPARVSLILERIIFYALLVLIAVVATPYGIVNPWRGAIEAVFECGIFALGVLWMIEGMLSRAWVSRRHLLLLPLLILTAFAYVQTLSLGGATAVSNSISTPVWQAISFDPYETQVTVLKLMAYALALGLLLRYTSTPGRFRVLVLVVIGIGVMSALFALLRQTTQRGATEFLFPFVRLDRGYGQFVNRNHFAFLMEMALGLALGLIAGGGRREKILLYLTAAIPVWVALVLSNSRGGILSMLCQLLLLALMFSAVRNPEKPKADKKEAASWLHRLGASRIFRLTLGAFLLAATFIGIVWVGGEQMVSRFETMPDEIAVETQESGYGVRRKEIWGATWQMIKEHPLAGVGLGGYWTAIPLYHNASGRMTPQQAHNDYLELLASGGVIGVLLCGWFVFLLIKFALRSLRSVDPFRRAACLGALTGIFGISIHSLVDFGLHIPINAFIFLVLVVIATVNGRVEEEKRAGLHAGERVR
jgi:O-antigen ligase